MVIFVKILGSCNLSVIFTYLNFNRRKGNLEPGQYYLQSDGVLKTLPPGQTAPRGTQIVSVKSNNPQQPSQPKQVCLVSSGGGRIFNFVSVPFQ